MKINIPQKQLSIIGRFFSQTGNIHYTKYTVEIGYNVTKGTKHFVSLWESAVLTEKCNIMVTVRNSLVAQNIWLYRRGVVKPDVVIKGFDLIYIYIYIYTRARAHTHTQKHTHTSKIIRNLITCTFHRMLEHIWWSYHFHSWF